MFFDINVFKFTIRVCFMVLKVKIFETRDKDFFKLEGLVNDFLDGRKVLNVEYSATDRTVNDNLPWAFYSVLVFYEEPS